jgi:hypothetical protein
VLLVQQWTADQKPIEASLRAEGIDASITRVDFVAALNAALQHDRYDVTIVDPTTPGVTTDVVHQCCMLNGHETNVVMLEDVRTIGARVMRALAPRQP